MLEGGAISQGKKPQQAIGAFFDRVNSYKALLSLEGQVKSAAIAVKKAKAEVEQWQAEAKAAEAKCKARKISIDLTEKILAQGVKASDLPEWTHILSKVNISPNHLAEEVNKFSSVEKLCQARLEKAKELEKQIPKLSSQVEALTTERDNVSAAIVALRDSCLSQIDGFAIKTQEYMAALMNKAADYGELKEKAAALSQEMALAIAIRELKPELWSKVSIEIIRNLLRAILIWCSSDTKNNLELKSPPDSLSDKLTIYSWKRVYLYEILQWALGGLFTDEEKDALGVK
jgi:chromosome segregation ATPase